MKFNYNQLSDKAYQLHQANKIEEAEKIYLELLKIKPDDYNVLNLLGLLYISVKQEEKAIKYLTKAYVLKKTAYVATNLGKAYYFNGEYEYAYKIFNQALELEKNDDIYFSLGLLSKKQEKYKEAIDYYNKAIECNPKNYKVLYNLALTYKQINDIDSALLAAEKSSLYCDGDEDVYILLSGFYEEKNQYENSINALKKAIEKNPRNHIYFYNLGVLYSKIDNISEAIIAYNTVIKLNPEYIEAYVNVSTLYKKTNIDVAILYLETAYKIKEDELNVVLSLAQCYKDSGKNDKSIEILEKLFKNTKNSAEAYSLYASNLMDIFKYKEALEYYNKAIIINPKSCDYKHGKAIALKYLGNIEESKKILEEIVNNPSISNQTLVTLGMMYLTEREFEKGSLLYRNRNKESKLTELYKENLWQPNVDLKDKIVLLYSDCGLGDTIMYARFIPQLEKIAKKVILQTDKELVKILKYNFKNIDIIKKSETQDNYDIVMSIMDIQLALNIDFNSIPSTEKYLSVEENNNLINSSKRKIGLFWQGNKRVFKNRSISIGELDKLFKIKNTDFYSFQIDSNIEKPTKVVDLAPNIKDYYDTAQLLKNIDVLITIDSSIVHMAGALGVKTCLLLPKTAEWRWFDDNEISSWYDSVKIYRQNESSDWSKVIQKIVKEIK